MSFPWKKVLIAAFVGGLLFTIWNAVSWLALPFHTTSLKNLPEEALQIGELKSLIPEAGVYHYPGLPETNDPNAWEELERKNSDGPIISMMVYQPGGRPLFSPVQFVTTLLIYVVSAFLLAVAVTLSRIPDYKRRLLLIVVVALFTSITTHISEWNWFGFPFGYTVVMVGDLLVGWSIAGAVMAKILDRSDK